MTGKAITDQQAEMTRAIGECIVAWSNVELQLSQIFRFALGGDPVAVDAVLAEPRNFDVRNRMVDAAVTAKWGGAPFFPDWRLLHSCANKLSKLRSEVAHALLLNVEGKHVALEPYFVVTRPRRHLLIEEVLARARQFQDLANALFWFLHRRLTPTPGDVPPKIAEMLDQEPAMLTGLREAAKIGERKRKRGDKRRGKGGRA